jgi:glycosyltransferase involved in cell wall biosynthesis
MPTPEPTEPVGSVEISVVIATAGRRELLERTLRALSAQHFPADRYEVIIVADAPSDDTPATLERWRSDSPARRRFVVTSRRVGPGAARNAGIALARGEIIAFTDDDCLPTFGWLRAVRHSLGLRPEAVGLVGRTVTTRRTLTPFSHYVENLDGRTHQTCNAAYRRSVLEQLRGFDPAFSFSLEDTDLYLRACQLGPVLFEPDAVVEHPPRELTFMQIVRRARSYEAEFIFARKHPDHYRERHRDRGPVFSLLYYTGLKHLLRLAYDHAPYGMKQPATYLKFVVACSLERLYLLCLLPRFSRRHRQTGPAE